MVPKKAVAKNFMTAFKTLPSSEQWIVLAQMLKMRRWRKDLIDIAIAEAHSQEKSPPFKDFLTDI